MEVQLTRELYYLERILYGVAKAITEHISLGEQYGAVKKVYSISIVYFDLGQGSDYLYHGTNSFVGVHTNDTLRVSTKEKDAIKMKTPEEVFPEYYIIRVNEFNKVAKTPLEEWIDYLKNGHIKDDTTAPGLSEAREKLQYLTMSKEERTAYERHMSAIAVQTDVLTCPLVFTLLICKQNNSRDTIYTLLYHIILSLIMRYFDFFCFRMRLQ